MVPPEKVTAVYNWVDFEPYETARPDGFRGRYGLEGKFVILFAGIMGPSQGLEFVVEVARRVADLKDVIFFLLGEGTSRLCLEKMARQYGLTNIRFDGFISPKHYPSLLKDIDVGLITLERNCKTPTIPGKFFGFTAASLPVLAFLNPESECHRVIKEAQCGYSIVPDDPEHGANLVRRMYKERDSLDGFGKNGYNYVRTHFSKQLCISKIEQLLTH